MLEAAESTHYLLSDLAKPQSIKALFAKDPMRAQSMTLSLDSLVLDYSKNTLTPNSIKALVALAESANLSDAIADLIAGKSVNTTEGRPAWHTALRAGNNQKAQAELANMAQLIARIESGLLIGEVTDVVHIGIGGSDLGPRLLLDALTAFHQSSIRIHFVANIDPAEINQVLAQCKPESTLFIVASKSFSTQETLENAQIAKAWLADNNRSWANHFIGITANAEKAQAWGITQDKILTFWDWVGGRFSVWSTIGLPVAIKIGMDAFKAFLDGGRIMDEHFASQPLEQNMPVMLALVGFWHHTVLKYPSQVILPYAFGLRKLPDYLQQLEMESNGKAVQTDGLPVTVKTCPMLWGQAGTNGQHAFYQLLHQGTQQFCADFILVANGHTNHNKQHQLLLSHGLAQSEALLNGFEDESPFKSMPGNKPSTTIVLESLSPKTLGMLIALYEHKVYVQSVLWKINAFDQPGVELGKRLAGKINAQLSGAAEDVCVTTSHLINILKSFQA